MINILYTSKITKITKKAVENVIHPQITKIGVRLAYNNFSMDNVNPKRIPKCPGSVIGPVVLKKWKPPISKIIVSYERIKPYTR